MKQVYHPDHFLEESVMTKLTEVEEGVWFFPFSLYPSLLMRSNIL